MPEEPNPSKVLIPRLRVPSLSFTDISQSGLSSSLRNISSSTSLLSTPSNNIRRAQRINGHKPKDPHSRSRKSRPNITLNSASTTAARKLLNLQELKRSLTVVQPFVLRKPADLSEFDYFVYARKVGPPGETKSDEKSPPVKESQIRAWESAEKVSANMIFDVEASASDDAEIFEDYDTSMDVAVSDDDLSFGDDYADCGDQEMPIVHSIPDYTKGELKILLDYYNKLQSCDSRVDIFIYEEAEKSALSIYREQQRIVHERAYKSNPKPLAKRKLQVFRKKELLYRLFGYSNNINPSYITNNTAYSAFDNVLNASKALQEDHDEIMTLLKLEEEFKSTQSQVAEKITHELVMPGRDAVALNGAFEPVLKSLGLLDFSNSWLTASYERQMKNEGAGLRLAETDSNSEIFSYIMTYLKACVREETS